MNDDVRPLRGIGLALPWLASLRPAHWIKNALVFAPMVFAHQELTASLLLKLVLAFLLCSLVASAGYLVNDIQDRNADRQHAGKRARPVAAGTVDITTAGLTAVGLSATAFMAAILFFDVGMAILLAVYLGTSVLYSAGIKRLPLVDVFVLSAFFCWRLYVGGAASGTKVSVWLLAFAFSLFLALAVAKRLDEVATMDRMAEGVLPGRAYGRRHLSALLLVSAGLAVITIGTLCAYIALRAGPDGLYRHEQWLWLSTALLSGWLLHVIARASAGRLHGDPVIFAASDPLSLVLAVAVAGSLIAAV